MAESKVGYCQLKDCRFHSVRVKNPIGSCAYIDITGHVKRFTEEQRQLYREGKIQCPFYEKGEPSKLRRRNNDLFPQAPKQAPGPLREKKETVRYKNIDTGPRRKLYNLGYNDYEIARALDISQTAIRQWRLYEGLPANAPKGNPEWMKMREKKLRGEKEKNGED